MKTWQRQTGLLLFCTGLIGLGNGCGSSEVPVWPVTGIVVFKDQSPVPSGVIEFCPVNGGPAARGSISSDGRFTLMTGTRTGAVEGPHQVSIIQMVVAEGITAEHAKQHKRHKAQLVHNKYHRFETSGLQQTVRANQENQFRIEVDAEPPVAKSWNR